ncbi:MAG: diphthine--ammonia ligase [Crocinitomicaceae bacterium]|nr:diphthine--ammonia ligase [Crocinitomicaceae bacterium]
MKETTFVFYFDSSMELKNTYFNWSTGKDASLALYYLMQNEALNVSKLVTSINNYHDRVSMHGLRRELLERQAESVGLPLTTIELPQEPSMEEYAVIMEKTVADLKSQNYTDCGFGDIHLEDLREYREKQLASHEITCHFPLWKRDTKEIIEDFIRLGFKAVVVCIKSELLDESFVGREIDESFINDLPENVDPCGENGEFHTFCYDGPIFSKAIDFHIGENVLREYNRPKGDDDHPDAPSKVGFWFCDLVPKQ